MRLMKLKWRIPRPPRSVGWNWKQSANSSRVEIMTNKKQQCEIGTIGSGVMGRNFLLNMADHGFCVAGYDKDPAKVAALRQEAKKRDAHGTEEIRAFIALLRCPRAVMLLVPAGAPVDSVIEELLPLLDHGDLLIDAGNSYFKDTDLRASRLAANGIHFLGVGCRMAKRARVTGRASCPGGRKKPTNGFVSSSRPRQLRSATLPV
jgi:6-phosphogluconate dehydrogenase